MTKPSNYELYWDRYVTELFPRAEPRDDVRWPGDEWGDEAAWRKLFAGLFRPAGVQSWERAVEIGPGAGKYTELVLEAAAGCAVAAFDVSGEYLKVCATRLADERREGRLTLHHLRSERADEMILRLERLGFAGRLDAVYSIDAMVHVDLQYQMAYLLTAALALKPGGHLVLTLPDATTDDGFSFLVSRVARFYGTQGRPVGKFEWLSEPMVRRLLEGLGFRVVRCSAPEDAELRRDLHVIAQLVDRQPARLRSWAVGPPPRPGGPRPVPVDRVPRVGWPAVDGARSYSLRFSRDGFATLAAAVDVEVGRHPRLAVPVPREVWSQMRPGMIIEWIAVADCEDRMRVANRGTLIATEADPAERAPQPPGA